MSDLLAKECRCWCVDNGKTQEPTCTIIRQALGRAAKSCWGRSGKRKWGLNWSGIWGWGRNEQGQGNHGESMIKTQRWLSVVEGARAE